MDKWRNQFDRLKRQWSEFNWIDSDYKPHDKRQIAKIGVAWVVKLPNEYFRKPVGWEVEIIDTPLGISERSNKLLKWLRHPPTNVYDNISLFNDSSEIILNESYTRHHSGFQDENEILLKAYEPQQRYTIPPNEYEIFRKTCCECKEKSFKNSSTEYDFYGRGSAGGLRLKDNNHFKLSSKDSYLTLQPENLRTSRADRKSYYSDYSEFEEELNNHILDAMTQSSFDRSDTSDHSKRTNTSRNHRGQESKRNISNVTNQSVETPKVSTGLSPRKEPSKIREHKRSMRNETMNVDNFPTHEHQNNHLTMAEIDKQTPETSTPRRRSTGPHIPSVDIFDDNILTRGTSLEQYRSTDRNFLPGSREAHSDYKRPNLNWHRNHHRHHHKRNGSKEVSIDATVEDNLVPSEHEPTKLEESFQQNDTLL